jgi:photosystem II stability/assembly factor-like uncharacterized protein
MNKVVFFAALSVLTLLPAILNVLLVDTALGQSDFWRQTNGPYGGSVSSISVGPEGYVYVGTYAFNGQDGGKISYSSDSGNKWTALNVKGSRIYKLFTTKSGALLANTDSSFYLSLDKGQTWNGIAEGIVTYPPSYVNLGLISEPFRGQLLVGVHNFGLFQSSTFGHSWALLDTSTVARSFSAIVSNTNGVLFGSGYLGVATSTDSGRTWISKNTGLEQTNHLVHTLTIDSGGILYITVNDAGFFRSTNGGDTWSKLSDRPSLTDDLLISPKTGDFFAVYGGVVFQSTDKGMTWNVLVNTLGSGIRHLAADSSGILYAAAELGPIYSSYDNGETWLTSGLPNTAVSAIAFDSSGTIYAGMYRYIATSKDGGNHWKTINEGLPPRFTLNALVVMEPSFIFACTDSGLYRAGIDSFQWTRIGISDQIVRCISTPRGDTIFAGAGTGIYKSTDKGESWTILSTPSIWIHSIVFNSSREILAGGAAGLIKSTDNGLTWSSLSVDTLLGGGFVNVLAIAPNGSIFAAGWYGLIRSTDDGTTWSWVFQNNDGFSLTALTVTPNGDVYIESGVAVLRSTDNGNSWHEENEGLWLWAGGPTCFGLSPDGFIYAGTWYGVFKSHPIMTSVVQSEQHSRPSHFVLSQNYPNPFNPSTTISFSISKQSQVSLKVYDVLGREVSILLDETKPMGSYSVQFNASTLPSGVYFYRLQAGEFVETKKTLVMK